MKGRNPSTGQVRRAPGGGPDAALRALGLRPDRAETVPVSGRARLADGRMFHPVRLFRGPCQVHWGFSDAHEGLLVNCSGRYGYRQTGDDFPAGGSIELLGAVADGLLVWVSSFIVAGTLHRIDMGDGSVEQLFASECSLPEARHLRLTSVSCDGTRVPVDCFGVFDRPRSTLVHVYGGFGRPNRPFHSAELESLWLAEGFNIALVHSRGGNEYGESWHTAAKKSGRHLAREDVEAAIRELHAHDVCTPSTTFLHGMSHGALLAATTALRSPGLVSHVVCQVPISDTRALPESGLGMQWMDEYGDPRTSDWDEFMAEEDPLALTMPQSLGRESIWFISGYVGDEVTPVRHADLLAERISGVTDALTYWRHTDNGGHQGAADPETRSRHGVELWSHLAAIAHEASARTTEQPPC